MSTELDSRAESLAASYLEELGYKIHARNYRTHYSEIDIVAEREKVIHIIEVKYRSNLDYGDGLEYISADKLKRLSRAAIMLMTNKPDRAYQIDVVAVSGLLECPEICLTENITA